MINFDLECCAMGHRAPGTSGTRPRHGIGTELVFREVALLSVGLVGLSGRVLARLAGGGVVAAPFLDVTDLWNSLAAFRKHDPTHLAVTLHWKTRGAARQSQNDGRHGALTGRKQPALGGVEDGSRSSRGLNQLPWVGPSGTDQSDLNGLRSGTVTSLLNEYFL